MIHRINRRRALAVFARVKCALGLVVLLSATAPADDVLTPEHVAKLRTVSSAKISPDGALVAYTVSTPRTPMAEDDGPAKTELHVVDRQGRSRAFVTGKDGVRGCDWTPDGRGISFLAKRGDDKHRALYVIAVDGGEARQVLSHGADIDSYDWHSDGRHVAFIAREKEDKQKKKLKDKGFSQEVYEEDWRPARVWIAARDDEDAKPRKLDLPGTALSAAWDPAGTKLLVALAPTPLIDDSYMARRFHVVDAESGEPIAAIETEGKLGQAVWSPDGSWIALITSADINDPSAGRLAVVPATGGKPRELIPNYEGHIRAIGWQSNETVMFIGHEGVHSTFGKINIDGAERKPLVPPGGPILYSLDLRADGMASAFVADSPAHPREVYTMQHGESEPRRLTDSNPWLSQIRLARQEVVEHEARDGLRLEGILIRPLDEEPGKQYPLILSVHGGPESHISNGWLTRYVLPGQTAAARGFAVFYPNYRGSTGRGVEFSKMGQADYGGGEFDDLVDAVDHLVKTGLVDRTKVGVTGGSYGGYASGWCATALTEHFAASVMYMGISDQISKFGTTDIPQEMNLVHARKWPWEDWTWFRERSPIYHAQKSRTPLLILHGKVDTRVHPSQSLELYRYLKTLGKTVRLVLYEKEGHGNRRAASRYDYNLRMLRWMEHYLKGAGGDPPAFEIEYGFEDTTEDENGDEADNDE